MVFNFEVLTESNIYTFQCLQKKIYIGNSIINPEWNQHCDGYENKWIKEYLQSVVQKVNNIYLYTYGIQLTVFTYLTKLYSVHQNITAV